MNIILGILAPCYTKIDLSIYMSVWPMFCSSVILPCTLNFIQWMNIICRILVPCNKNGTVQNIHGRRASLCCDTSAGSQLDSVQIFFSQVPYESIGLIHREFYMSDNFI